MNGRNINPSRHVADVRDYCWQTDKGAFMNNLSRIFIFKIAATVIVWCIPLLLFPASVLEIAGLPQ